MEGEKQTIGFPRKSKSPIYHPQDSLYLKVGKSTVRFQLYCSEYRSGCPSKLAIDKNTGNCQLFVYPSHSKLSRHLLKYTNVEGRETVVNCSIKSGRLWYVPFCKYCRKSFHNFDHYKRHLRRHEKYYLPFWRFRVKCTCKYCKQRFLSLNALRQHGMAYPYQCASCETCFSSASKYLSHKTNKQSGCGNLVQARLSATPSFMPYYKRNQMSATVAPSSERNLQEESLVCPHCRKTFESGDDVHKHTIDFPIFCPACRMCLATSSEYVNHAKIHKKNRARKQKLTPSNERDSQGQMEECLFCAHCRKIFESRDDVHKHTIDYPIYCSACQTCLATVLEYVNHKRLHRRFSMNNREWRRKSCSSCGCKFDSVAQNLDHACSPASFTKYKGTGINKTGLLKSKVKKNYVAGNSPGVWYEVYTHTAPKRLTPDCVGLVRAEPTDPLDIPDV